MAKKSRKKRLVQFKKDQSGCMKSLFNNIFDFRHDRSSRKLLQDKKHESKRIAGAAYSGITIESLSEHCEICQEFSEAVQNETSTNDDDKMSVKELMAEEMMIDEQVQKNHGSNASNGARVQKSSRRARSMTSLSLNADDVAHDEHLVAEKPRHRKHKSLSSIYLNVMVEELCSHINHTDGEVSTQLIEDPSVIEEKLWEATRSLVSHYSDGKSIAKDGKIQASKELVDALRTIDSNKEVFLKLLEDPNSQLVKHIQNLQEVQVEEGKFKLFTDSNLLEKRIGNGKQQSFFWRRFKGSERNPSKKNNNSEDLNRIVVLKPVSRDSETASSCSSLPESPRSSGERNHSGFSFQEFKRKLKHVMRKEQNGVVLENRDKKVGGETIAMASPGKDHFFIERIPKSSLGGKMADKTGKLKDGDTSISAEQRVSDIYVEAKKHLAEIISDNNVDADSLRKVPRSLGRLMSFSGYGSPTLGETKQESRNEADVLPLEPRISDGLSCEAHIPASGGIVKSPYVESQGENNLMEGSSERVGSTSSSKCSEENWHSPILGQNTCTDSELSSSSQSASTLTYSVTDKIEDRQLMSDATSKPSPISVLEPLFPEDDVSPPSIKSLSGIEPVQPRKIHFEELEEEISSPSNNYHPYNKTYIEDDKYTLDFVKDVLQMSGLTWDELHRRTLYSDHLIDPSLLDEVDFLPDLLPCDFNLLFDLINEVLIEISWMNFGCMISSEKLSTLLKLKNKDIFTEIWKGVEWYLKLDGPPRTLDQIVEKDLVKSRVWMNLQPDTETIGIQLHEAILEELLEDAFF